MWGGDHIKCTPSICNHIIFTPLICNHLQCSPSICNHILFSPLICNNFQFSPTICNHTKFTPSICSHIIYTPSICYHMRLIICMSYYWLLHFISFKFPIHIKFCWYSQGIGQSVGKDWKVGEIPKADSHVPGDKLFHVFFCII